MEAQTEITSPTLAFSRLGFFQKILRIALWVLLALGLLLFFTYWKLPEARLKNFIYGNISSQLGSQGITFTASQTSLSFGLFGVTYEMKELLFHFPKLDRPVSVDEVSLSPSLFDFLFGSMGGSFKIKLGDGKGSGSFSFKNSKGSSAAKLQTDLSFKSLHIGKLGALEMWIGLRGGGLLSGNIQFSGPLDLPEAWEGETHLQFSKINFESQMLSGFSIPEVNISEGVVDLQIVKGSVQVKNLKLGKKGSMTDDLVGSVSGDIVLGKKLESSTLKLKSHFSFSQNVQKAFVLLDTLLVAGKQPDGGYAFSFTGSFFSPQFTPGG